MTDKLHDGKGQFMIRQWEDLKRSGGITFNLDQMEQILKGGEAAVLTREEVMNKVLGYFNGCVKVVMDEDTQEPVTTWVRNPTKSGLALCLGIDKQTLIDYVKGLNSEGKQFSRMSPDHKRVVATEDFDILRRAYALIETFYEEKLGENRNNAGVIYWLNNASNGRWSNEQEFKFSSEQRTNFITTRTPEEIAASYGQSINDISDLQLPEIPD